MKTNYPENSHGGTKMHMTMTANNKRYPSLSPYTMIVGDPEYLNDDQGFPTKDFVLRIVPKGRTQMVWGLFREGLHIGNETTKEDAVRVLREGSDNPPSRTYTKPGRPEAAPVFECPEQFSRSDLADEEHAHAMQIIRNSYPKASMFHVDQVFIPGKGWLKTGTADARRPMYVYAAAGATMVNLVVHVSDAGRFRDCPQPDYRIEELDGPLDSISSAHVRLNGGYTATVYSLSSLVAHVQHEEVDLARLARLAIVRPHDHQERQEALEYYVNSLRGSMLDLKGFPKFNECPHHCVDLGGLDTAKTISVVVATGERYTFSFIPKTRNWADGVECVDIKQHGRDRMRSVMFDGGMKRTDAGGTLLALLSNEEHYKEPLPDYKALYNRLKEAVGDCLPDLEHYASTHGPGPDLRLDSLKNAM